MNIRVLVLADDLTGALEVGALFAGRGLPALVTMETRLDLECLEETALVHVIDTETRHLAPDEAFHIVDTIARAAPAQGFRYIYKKTDSTLRGNIASELSAIAAACPDFPLVYVPAYPRLGRTVIDGNLYVNGVPVSETMYSADKLNPVRESHIPTLLESARLGIPVRSIRVNALHESMPAAVYVLDGTTEEDLRSSARFFAGTRQLSLAAGPAGFAPHFADFVDLPRSAPPPMPSIRSCLVVNGSRHEMSAAQIQHAKVRGWPVIDVASASPAPSGWIILQNPSLNSATELDFAAQLGELVRSILKQVSLDAMVVFGGDTVCGIFRAIGLNSVRPMGEVLPGVPVARVEAVALAAVRCTRKQDFYLITKAGGFGARDLLTQVRERLPES
jgi:uncharacterized protein YgbK (DUF1537 family)